MRMKVRPKHMLRLMDNTIKKITIKIISYDGSVPFFFTCNKSQYPHNVETEKSHGNKKKTQTSQHIRSLISTYVNRFRRGIIANLAASIIATF